MAELLVYDKLSSAQKQVYDKIVDFGNEHGFSAEDINIAALVAFTESRFKEDADSGTGATGVFQFTGIRWKDWCSETNYSGDGVEVYNTLVDWGYSPSEFDRSNTDNQIAVFYAGLKLFSEEYAAGENSTAYNNACASLGDACPTSEYYKKALYVQSEHHGPSQIQEVVAGWKKSMLPNLDRAITWSINNLPIMLSNLAIKALRSIFNAGEKVVPQAASPIILDLDKDGVETTALTSGTYFDHDANGFSEQTGWASNDDGLLVMDRDNDGTIDNGTELFGNETLLANGTKATNGFQALKELDTNNDNKIDMNDAAYSQLRVWQDVDEDGYTSEGELKTLSELGIQSINTFSFQTISR